MIETARYREPELGYRLGSEQLCIQMRWTDWICGVGGRRDLGGAQLFRIR